MNDLHIPNDLTLFRAMLDAFEGLTEDITDVHEKPWLKTALISHMTRWAGESAEDTTAHLYATALVNLMIPDEHPTRHWVIMRGKFDEITRRPVFWNDEINEWTLLTEATLYKHHETAGKRLPDNAYGWVELPTLPPTS
jgi:hypothetical protein